MARVLAFIVLHGLLSSPVHAKDLPGGLQVSSTVQPSRAIAGSVIEMTVRIDVPDGWIVYDIEQSPMSAMPTRIELNTSENVVATGSFRSEEAREEPAAAFGGRVARFFDRSPTFRRPLQIATSASPGTISITGRVTFLARHRATRRFYVINEAPFSVDVEIESPSPAISPAEPSSTPTVPLLQVEVPAGPVPSFHIVVDPFQAREFPTWLLISWGLTGLIAVILAVAACYLVWVVLVPA